MVRAINERKQSQPAEGEEQVVMSHQASRVEEGVGLGGIFHNPLEADWPARKGIQNGTSVQQSARGLPACLRREDQLACLLVGLFKRSANEPV